MAGHMGDKKRTTQNLRVVAIDAEKGLVFVEGAVPGHKNSWVTVCDAVKKVLPQEAPKPAGLKVAVVASDSSQKDEAGAQA